MQTRCLQSLPGTVLVDVQGCTCTGPVKRLEPKQELFLQLQTCAGQHSVRVGLSVLLVGSLVCLSSQVLGRSEGFIAWDHEFLFAKIFIDKFSTGQSKNQWWVYIICNQIALNTAYCVPLNHKWPWFSFPLFFTPEHDTDKDFLIHQTVYRPFRSHKKQKASD